MPTYCRPFCLFWATNRRRKLDYFCAEMSPDRCRHNKNFSPNWRRRAAGYLPKHCPVIAGVLLGNCNPFSESNFFPQFFV